MKKLIIILIAIVLLFSITTPALAAGAFQSHGTHGQGVVNQYFEGVPPGDYPWDLPPNWEGPHIHP